MLGAIVLYLVVSLVAYSLDPEPSPAGYTYYDPCIQCNDDWQFYPISKTESNTVNIPQKMTMED